MLAKFESMTLCQYKPMVMLPQGQPQQRGNKVEAGIQISAFPLSDLDAYEGKMFKDAHVPQWALA